MTRLLRLAAPVLALLLAAPAAAQKVTGKILPPAGGKTAAFDKVQVELAPASMDYGQALRRLEGKSDPPLATVRPRPDGSFEIVAPEPGLYVVTIRAAGFLPLRHLLHPLFEDVELPPVELEPSHPFEVRAVGPDGSPLPGVQMMASARFRPSPWQPAEVLGVTGPDGRVTLPDVTGAVEVVAFSPRLGLQYTETRERSATLRFPAAKLLTLEVRDTHGKKTAGALFRFAHFPPPLGLTGPEGRLTLPLPEHEMPLLVETADGQAASLKLGPLSTGPRVVELAAPVIVSGKVLAADRRVPVPGALVWSGGTRPVRTGEDGGFRIQVYREHPEAGLLAAAPGYLPGYSSDFLRSGEGTPALVTLLLPPVGFIAGRVVDAGGRPISEAQIRIGGSGRSSGDLTGLKLRSGPDGSFKLSRLQAGESYELQVRKEGFAPASIFATAVPARPPAAPVRIVLSRGGAVFGRTVDEDGEPVAGATVELRPWEDPMRGGFRSDEPAAGTATSGTDGRFEVRHLSPGVFVLQARLDGFAPGVLSAIEIPAGTPQVDAGTVTLSPEAVVTGQVVDPRGAPIAGATVRAFPEQAGDGWDRHPPETGTDGRFRIDGLPQGVKVRVEARARGYGEAKLDGLELPLPEPLRIELRPLVHLTGRVVDPAGEPVPGASLTLIRRHPGGYSGYGVGDTDDQGRFRLDVEPGLVEIRVNAQGYTDGSWRGMVPEQGEAGPVEITLGSGAVLEGRVLDPAGNPVAGAFVSAFAEGSPSSADAPAGSSGRAESDADGRYRIAGLATGPHRVSAHDRDGAGNMPRRFEVQPGSNQLDLTLDPGREVSGWVRDQAGTPIPGAEVMLSSPTTNRGIGGASSADGSFRLRGVVDGSYRITAHHRNAGLAWQEVEVAGRSVQELDLRLGPAGAITGRLLGLTPADLSGVRVEASATFHGEPGTIRPDGTYRISGLPPGEWRVSAELPSGRRAGGTVRLEPGMTEAILDLELGGDLSVSGVVRIDGAPRSGVMIVLQSLEGGQGATQAVTSADGTFRMTHLAAGTYRWMIQDQETATSLQRQVELSTDLETAVEITTGTVRGQALSPEGAPVGEGSLSLEGRHGDWIVHPFVRVDRQGRFELRVPAGEYRTVTLADGVPVLGEPFEVPAGGTATVQVVLEPPRR